MARWYPLEDVDDAFFTSAPHRYVYVVDLDAPPARVWESLASDQSLAAWGPGVKSLRWLSPRPFGVGTTREVVLPLGLVSVRERFTRWDAGSGDSYRYSFGVYEANRPLLRRLGEDYVVAPGAGGGTRLTWTVALEAAPKFRRLVALTSPLNKASFGLVARSAKRYFRSR